MRKASAPEPATPPGRGSREGTASGARGTSGSRKVDGKQSGNGGPAAKAGASAGLRSTPKRSPLPRSREVSPAPTEPRDPAKMKSPDRPSASSAKVASQAREVSPPGKTGSQKSADSTSRDLAKRRPPGRTAPTAAKAPAAKGMSGSTKDSEAPKRRPADRAVAGVSKAPSRGVQPSPVPSDASVSNQNPDGVAPEPPVASASDNNSSSARAVLRERLAGLEKKHDDLASECKGLQDEVGKLQDAVKKADANKEMSKRQAMERLNGLEQEIQSLSSKVDVANSELTVPVQVATSEERQCVLAPQSSVTESPEELREKVRSMEKVVSEKSALLEVVMAQVHASQRAQGEVARIIQQNTAALQSLYASAQGRRADPQSAAALQLLHTVVQEPQPAPTLQPWLTSAVQDLRPESGAPSRGRIGG